MWIYFLFTLLLVGVEHEDEDDFGLLKEINDFGSLGTAI